MATTQIPRRKVLYESRREREFYRYYEPIRALTQSGPVMCDLHDEASVQAHKPYSCPDKALTAFCQLGALRLGTRRAMLFFFDSKYAYILAEATRTLSLQDDKVHDIDDSLWLGHSIIPRGFTICEETVCRTPADGESTADDRNLIHVINDITADRTFCDRPYVTDGPKARFYAGVPITTPKGINIGAFCCLDDRKRDGLDEKGMAFLRDMASTVMAHLDMVRAKSEHERGTRMVTGLGAFIEGAAHLQDGTRIDGEKNRLSQVDADNRPALTSLGDPKQPAGYDSAESVTTVNSTNASNVTPSDTAGTPSRAAVVTSREAGDVRDHHVPPNVRSAFQRAADILREAVDVDGVVFLDPTVTTYGALVDGGSGSEHSSDAFASGTEAAGTGTDSDGRARGKATPDKTARSFSSSHAPRSLVQDTGAPIVSSNPDISERFLRGLLRRYPHGRIWNFNQEGDASSDDDSSSDGVKVRRTDQQNSPHGSKNDGGDEVPAQKVRRKPSRIDDGRQIQRLFPGIRSLALVGMFDQTRGKWFSACAVWTYSPLRLFSTESEVNYISAFCDVIMAEVHRLEAQNSDRAKSDFISSISHELRSPLHGILGSVECLQEEQSDPFSSGLVSQIEVCGRTLLDIVDHLLDYSKINARVRGPSGSADAKGRKRLSGGTGRQVQLSGIMSLDANVALDKVTEEVVETAVYSFCCSRDKQTILSRKVDVILDIDRSSDISWRSRIPLGGWKRICMNLISNALKYTSEGYIKVSLKAALIVGRRRRFNVIFSVADSGRGMSRDFLENHLFKAFSQEDSLMEGTGLGMSLVATIVRAMGGSVEVQSEKDVGTTMTVTVPVEHSRSSATAAVSVSANGSGDGSSESGAVHQSTSAMRTISEQPFRGSCLSILDLTVRDSNETSESSVNSSATAAKTLLLQSIEHTCEDLGLDTQRGELPGQNSDLSLIFEHDLVAYKQRLKSLAPRTRKPLIVICQSAISARQLRAVSSRSALNSTMLEFIAQPCGPERLAKAIGNCFGQRQIEPPTPDEQAVSGAATSEMVAAYARTPGSPVTNMMARPLPQRTRSRQGDEGESLISPKTKSPAATPRPLPSPNSGKTGSATPSSRLNVGGDYFSSRSKSTGDSPKSPQVVDPVKPKRHSVATIPENSPCLLLVDDNQINLQLLINYATKQGHRHLQATDGHQAVEVYKAACMVGGYDSQPGKHSVPISSPALDKPQVILMDISMPVLNGFEATRMIRQFEQQHDIEPAHIIALTGLGSASAQQEAFSSGVDLFLTKPVRLKELTALLKSWANNKAGDSAGAS